MRRTWRTLWLVTLWSCSGSGGGGQADLTAENLALAPQRVPAGQQGVLTFALKNAGGGDVGSFRYQVFIEGNDRGTRVMVAEETVEELARGRTASQSIQVTIPAATRSGSYQLSVVLDPDGRIAESNEDNNTVVAASPITVLPRGSDVNLQPSGVSLSVATVLPDDLVTVSYSLRNQGTDGVVAATKVFFYLSSDDSLSEDDRKIGEQTVARVNAGQSLSLSSTLSVPGDVAAGNYTVLVVADGGLALPESNENDNVAGAPLKVESGTIQGTDLVITALSVAPTSVPRGGGVTVSFTIKNRGDTATASSFFNRIFLSPAPTYTPGQAEQLDTVNVTSLGANESLTRERSVVIPASRTPGTYYIVVVADPSNVVAETNDQNNVRVDTSGLTVSPPAQADVLVTNVAVSGAGGTVTAGSQVTVSFRAVNNGPDATGSITAAVVLSTDATAGSDRTLGTVNIVNLASGQHQDFSQPVTIPTDVDNRRYFLGVIADPDQRLTDPSRTNNAAFESTGITVTGGGGCTEDTYEPNDTRAAARLLQPGSYPSLFLCTGNEDHYAVRVEAGSTIKATMASSDSSLDLDLYLYEPGDSGALIDSSSSSGSAEEVFGFFLPTTGDYILRVRGFSSRPGPYSLSITVTPAGGNGIDLAAAGATFTPSRVDPGDVINVTVDARNPGQVASAEFRFGVELVPASGSSCTTPVNLGSFAVQALPAGGARTITQEGVTVPQGTCNGDYNVRVKLDPGNEVNETYEENNEFTTTSKVTVGGIGGCVDDAQEPNDVRQSAKPLAPGTYTNLKACSQDDDWYSIFLAAGERLQVRLDFTHSQGDIDVRLEDEAGGYLDSSTGVGNSETIDYTATATERVYLRVYNISSGAGSPYTMTVTGGAGVDLVVKDLTVSPMVQEVGEDVTVSFTVENTLPLASGATTAQVKLKPATGAETVAHTANVPSLGATTTDGPREAYSLRITLPPSLAPGTYEVVVVVDPANTIREGSDTNNSASAIGFRAVPQCVTDSAEPNDGAGDAFDVTPTSGTQRTLTNLKVCLGDTDWYKVVVASGQTRNLTAAVTFTQANGDLDLYLYRRESNGSTTELARSKTTQAPETITQNGLGAGTYLLKVVGFNNATNDYGLQITLAP